LNVSCSEYAMLTSCFRPLQGILLPWNLASPCSHLPDYIFLSL
jgi:hypothetical protein